MSYDYAVERLAERYRQNRVARKTVQAEIREKYRDIIAKETEAAMEEIDREFSQDLARAVATYHIPTRIIQDKVLRTRSWDRWVHFRDLANVSEVEEGPKTGGFEFEPREGGEWKSVLVVRLNRDGEEIEPFEITDFVIAPERDTYNVWPMGSGLDIPELWGGTLQEFAAATRDLVKAAYEAEIL